MDKFEHSNNYIVLKPTDNLGLTHIQYQGETLPLVLAFHLVLGKFRIYASVTLGGEILSGEF